jgi:predicted dehydrogenase
MSVLDRRGFLHETGAGLAVLAGARVALADEAPRRVVIAIIGTGGMGTGHVKALAARTDVEIAWVCDVDASRRGAAADIVEAARGTAPQETGDLRRVLADPRVEAVWIATPDHWHVPAAVLALDAGKHVYVEKPCCHNLREGEALEAAVRRSGRRLQVGTQSRSTAVVRAAIDHLRAGDIGDILVAKAWNSQKRGTIGRQQPAEPPPQLDYDLWLGPAPHVPYRPNLLPGVWRWWYDFGCGDIGNDGVHDIDVAVWGLGAETHPTRIACLGGKYFFDDDMQFPDTQYAVFEYPRADRSGPARQLIFEQRIWSPYVQEGYENGAAFYGTNGMLIIGHTVGWKLYGPRNRLVAEMAGQADLVAHHDNFLACVRDPAQVLNADVRAGVLSAGLVHLANIAARVGRVLEYDLQQRVITGDAEATTLLGRKYRDGHWAIPRQG